MSTSPLRSAAEGRFQKTAERKAEKRARSAPYAARVWGETPRSSARWRSNAATSAAKEALLTMAFSRWFLGSHFFARLRTSAASALISGSVSFLPNAGISS